MVTWGLKAEGGFHSPSAVPSRSICTGAERVASRFSCSWHVWEEEHSHLTFTFALSSALMENIEAGEEQRTLLSVLCIQGQGRRRRRQRIRMLEFQDPLVSLLTKVFSGVSDTLVGEGTGRKLPPLQTTAPRKCQVFQLPSCTAEMEKCI